MSVKAAPDMPAFHGYIETTGDALRVIWAAHRGQVSRLSRRLNETERKRMIRSGTVFVFSVDESGIKRWTDGLMWSPSRIVGNFLVYRELSEKGQTRGQKRRTTEEDVSYPRENGSNGSLPNDQATFKVDGLTKKTITIKVRNSDLHLIAYYTQADLNNGALRRPIMDPTIMAISLSSANFHLTNLRNPPRITMTEDGRTRIDDEIENEDPSASGSHQYPRLSSPSSNVVTQGFQRGLDRPPASSIRRLSAPGTSGERHTEFMSPRFTLYGQSESYNPGGQQTESNNLHEGITRIRSHTVGVDPRTSVYPTASSWSTQASASSWHPINRTGDYNAFNDGGRDPSYQFQPSPQALQSEEGGGVYRQDAPSWNECNPRMSDFREVGQVTQQIGSSSRQFHHPSLSPSPMPSSPMSPIGYYAQQSSPSIYVAPSVDMLAAHDTLVGQPTTPTQHAPYTTSQPPYTLATSTANTRYGKKEEEDYRAPRAFKFTG